jgi:ABC-type multidrug transport system ATPase subunit
MGENGAGKSTLVQMVAGALSVDSGDITVETARGPLSAQKRRRRIGLITHQPMVYGELTALENVEHFARLGGVPAPRERAHRLLAELGLDPDSPKPASQFSRGMLARLSASRALVTGPDLLLLDEAASGLDRHGRRTLVDRVVRLAGEAVVLMATHHEETAARVAQHLVVLRRGRVALDESLRELSEAERLDRIRAALEAR